METFAIAVGSLVLYIVAYHTYGRWLSRKIFRLDAKAAVPSKQLNDGQDYVPTRKAILFGHHFTSIAGTGPIVGPALAVIWGWLPALLWVLFGSIFIGAVHDLGALVVSIRNRGQTIGEVAGRLINPRVKILFLLILFLALTIVLAIFGLVIASIFAMYPASVLAVWLAMPVAIVVGILIYKKGISPHVPALIALLIMIGAVVLAAQFEFLQLEIQPFTIGGLTISPIISWTLALLVYCYFASVLPVWLLLQPRDYVNSYLLVLGLLLLVCGIGAATFFTEGGAPMVAPAIRTEVAGAPPIMPFLFV
ncbi:MAG: carbon starvation protein A, partial [Planctomycetota bacterium]|nr:carbon starvation protein A [Planctomycetota bacterium]